MEIMFGAMRAGVVFTPISTHLKRDETAYIIDNRRAKLFIASDSWLTWQQRPRRRHQI